MIRSIVYQQIFLYVTAGVCLLGLLSKFITHRLFRRFMKASGDMPSSNNKLIRQIRLKYENAYRANAGMNNIQAFVDKYVFQYRFLGLSLHRLSRLTINTMLLSAALGIAGAGTSYFVEGAVTNRVLFHGGAGAAAVLLLLFSQYMLSARYSKNVMMANMVDYLENTLACRLKNEVDAEAEVRAERRRHLAKQKLEEEESELLGEQEAAGTNGQEQLALTEIEKPVKKRFRKKQQNNAEEEIQQMKKSLDQIAAGNTEKQEEERQLTRSEQQEIIEEILKEYLT